MRTYLSGSTLRMSGWVLFVVMAPVLAPGGGLPEWGSLGGGGLGGAWGQSAFRR